MTVSEYLASKGLRMQRDVNSLGISVFRGERRLFTVAGSDLSINDTPEAALRLIINLVEEHEERERHESATSGGFSWSGWIQAANMPVDDGTTYVTYNTAFPTSFNDFDTLPTTQPRRGRWRRATRSALPEIP